MDLQKYRATGCLELNNKDLNDPDTMGIVQKLMDASQDEEVRQIQQLAIDYDIDEGYAHCIVYLRTRSRWTEESEQKLIQMAKSGEPVPNMNEWG